MERVKKNGYFTLSFYSFFVLYIFSHLVSYSIQIDQTVPIYHFQERRKTYKVPGMGMVSIFTTSGFAALFRRHSIVVVPLQFTTLPSYGF